MKPSDTHLALLRLIGKQRPAFLWGAPGVGKSDIVRQVAEELSYELRDVRMSMMDPVDMKGFPIPDTKKGVMKWLPPEFLPTSGKGILFLDEMNSAVPAMQATGYQLILNHRIGEFVLPPDWYVLAAGNRAQDRSVTHAQPAALANRFVHIDVDFDLDDWSAWAMTHGICDELRAFARFRPALMHNQDGAASQRAFGSPRSWAMVNDIFNDGHAPAVEHELIAGTVGEGNATEFRGFVRLISTLPSVDEVLLNPETTVIPTGAAGQYAITSALEPKTTATTFARVMKYLQRLPVELQIVYMRAVTRRDAALSKTRTYTEWSVRNASVLT